MSYLLKKTKNKEGTYLQIYASYYDPERKGGAHRSYKPIGYVHELQANGIDNPIAFFSEEVLKLNQDYQKIKQSEKSRQISSESPEKLLGYFPLKNFNHSLAEKNILTLCRPQPISDSMYLICYPLLFMQFDTSHTYFDCTNFYFEIDREDDFRLNRPSKENKKEPIVGLGLLLDTNQIPIGMKMYPGNESEKPVMRNILNDLKQRNHISGRTIRVADKGLNCFNNILHALKAGDEYIFSKSVKTLPETEKTWVLLENDYVDVKNKKGEVLYRIKECVDDFTYTCTDDTGHRKALKLAKNVL